ncbi:MAG: rhomboid family intramembrane serine protease [Ferruginibacter sp.]
MGESDRYQDYRHVRRRNKFTLGSDNNALMNLFVLNVIFFLILLTVQVAYYFYQQSPQVYNAQVIQWFELPSSLTKLSERPWTLLTYGFSDTGNNIFRIISNMLWLWAFGYILQELAGNDKIIPIYIYGTVLGGIVFIAAHYMIPALRPQINNAGLLGANAGTVAVAMATTTLSPNYKFFRQLRGGISIWILMAVYLFIDFAGVASKSSAVSFSHLGGALAGFLFVVFLRRGRDGSVWMNKLYNWVTNLFTPPKKSGKEISIKEKIFYNTGNRNPYSKTSIVTQQRVDEILDKINQKGYHFLTDEEKQILKKAAEEEDL